MRCFQVGQRVINKKQTCSLLTYAVLNKDQLHALLAPVMNLSKSVAGRLSYGMIVYTSAVYLRIYALMQPFTIDSSMYDNFAAA